MNLLLRFYDPQGGSIRIDGHEVRSFTQDSLHTQLALIPQDPTLFHRTLRENIRDGRADASDEEVEGAARRAHADEFIRSIPGGYEAKVGERGVKLSGGQRQRIAIARVILKNAPVLDPRRGHLESRFDHRSGHPRGARCRNGEQDRDRDRPPLVDHLAPRPDPSVFRGSRSGRWQPQRVARATRRLSPAVEPPVRRGASRRPRGEDLAPFNRTRSEAPALRDGGMRTRSAP